MRRLLLILLLSSPLLAEDLLTNQTGIALPPNTWINVGSTSVGTNSGYYGTGYWNTFYVPGIDSVCQRGSWREPSSEPNRSWFCWSWDENRYNLMSVGSTWHNWETSEGGHTVGEMGVDTFRNLTVGYCCNSGSQVSEAPRRSGETWDFLAQTGRMGMSPSSPFVYTQLGWGAYDPYDQQFILHGGTGGSLSSGTNAYSDLTNTWQLGLGVSCSNACPSIYLSDQSSAINTSDKNLYMFGGSAGASTINTLYKFNYATLTWTQLSPSGGPPAARQDAGWAYDSNENVFLLFGGCASPGGGCSGASILTDTWIYDPVANAWTQLSPAASPTGLGFASYQTVSYLPEHDVFVAFLPSGIWVYRYAPGAGYKSRSLSYSYSAGTLNRNTTSPSVQTWAYGGDVATDGTNVYQIWSENTTDLTFTEGGYMHPYVQKTSGSTVTDLGNSYSSLTNDASNNVEAFDPVIGVVGSTPWACWHQQNTSSLDSITCKSWNGSAWGSGGQIPSVATPGYDAYPRVIGVGGTPTIAFREENRTYEPSDGLYDTFGYVTQWTGSAYSLLGTAVNKNSSSTRVDSIDVASNGTVPYVAWTEYTTGSTGTPSNTFSAPQVYLNSWSGTAWVAQCGGNSANITGTDSAFYVSMTYMSGQPYIAFVERSTAGNNMLYVRTCSGGSWSTVGSGALNRDANYGWAWDPHITNDGTNLYVTWAEQGNDQPWLSGLALMTSYGQKPHVYAAKWNGSAWSYLGGALNADAVNGAGAATHPRIASLSSGPVVQWGEVSTGNLRQMYAKQWSGIDWTPLGSSPSGLSLSCPAATTGTVGVGYSSSFTASGGTPGYTYSMTSGSLPAGLSLNNSSGLISGTPTTANAYSFVGGVTDAASGTSTASCSITISGGGSPPSITTSSPLPSGTASMAYSDTLVATNSPTSWAVASGSVCAGLALNTGSGLLSGTPTTAQTCSFGITASNSFGTSSPVVFTLTISPALAGGVTRISGSINLGGNPVIH